MTRRRERDGTLRPLFVPVQASHAFAPSLLALASAPQEGAEQWILIVVWALALLGVGAAAVAVLVRLRRDLASATDAADHLARIESAVARLAEREEGLDLRRLEHVLIDMRDGQRRLEERLLSLTETLGSVQSADADDDRRAPSLRLSERVISRLLALGYERIEVLTPFDEFDQILVGDGEMEIEARKSGALYKGRVMFRDGAIVDVKLRSSYEAYP